MAGIRKKSFKTFHMLTLIFQPHKSDSSEKSNYIFFKKKLHIHLVSLACEIDKLYTNKIGEEIFELHK